MKTKINGIPWTIETAPGDSALLHVDEGICYGTTYLLDKRIVLNAGAPQEQQRKTLWHELAHAFIHETQAFDVDSETVWNEELCCRLIGMYGDEIAKIAAEYGNEQTSA